jgi:ribosomal protein S1
LLDLAKLKKGDLINLLFLANQKIRVLNKQLDECEFQKPSKDNEKIKTLEAAIRQKDL